VTRYRKHVESYGTPEYIFNSCGEVWLNQYARSILDQSLKAERNDKKALPESGANRQRGSAKAGRILSSTAVLCVFNLLPLNWSQFSAFQVRPVIFAEDSQKGPRRIDKINENFPCLRIVRTVFSIRLISRDSICEHPPALMLARCSFRRSLGGGWINRVQDWMSRLWAQEIAT
jgi:hypothetical protein